MTATHRLMTAEEFEKLPEPFEGGKSELWYGEVVRMAPVGEQHGDGASRILVPMAQFVWANKLGVIGPETGFRLLDDLVLAPDASFRATAPGARPATGFVGGPPTLAVEVVSPGDSAAEVQRKVDAYLANGTARVWYVYPDQRVVVVHRPDNTSRTFHAGDILSSDDAGFSVDGFALALRELFGA